MNSFRVLFSYCTVQRAGALQREGAFQPRPARNIVTSKAGADA